MSDPPPRGSYAERIEAINEANRKEFVRCISERLS